MRFNWCVLDGRSGVGARDVAEGGDVRFVDGGNARGRFFDTRRILRGTANGFSGTGVITLSASAALPPFPPFGAAGEAELEI